MSHNSPISRITILVLVLGLAGCDKLGLGKDTPDGPKRVAPGSTIVYDAIGASDADGVGSSLVCCVFVDCPNGMGYPQVATRQLNALGFKAGLANLGIPTAVIGRDFEALGQQYNRTILANFITDEVPFVRTTATVVTIFAGVNEINTITSALGGGAGAADQAAYIDAQVKAFGADYTTLLAGIRSAPARRASSCSTCRTRRPAVSGRRLAGAASGRAARGGRHDEERWSTRWLVVDHRRRSDVRRAQLRCRRTILATACIRTTPATRSSPPKSCARSRRASIPRRRASCGS